MVPLCLCVNYSVKRSRPLEQSISTWYEETETNMTLFVNILSIWRNLSSWFDYIFCSFSKMWSHLSLISLAHKMYLRFFLLLLSILSIVFAHPLDGRPGTNEFTQGEVWPIPFKIVDFQSTHRLSPYSFTIDSSDERCDIIAAAIRSYCKVFKKWYYR